MIYENLIGKDLTVYTNHSTQFRGILKEVDSHDALLTFEVGIDEFIIRADALYAITIHGTS